MNKFDTLALLFVVSVCALPLLKLTDKDIGARHYGTLTVFLTPDNSSLTELNELSCGAEAIAEGRFAFTLSGQRDGCAVLYARGRMCEAGYMHEGGRLLAKNQPLELYVGDKPLFGRILRIEFSREADARCASAPQQMAENKENS